MKTFLEISTKGRISTQILSEIRNKQVSVDI
jgi:hypothetical protein